MVELDMVPFELGPDRSPIEGDFIDTELTAMEELYVAMDDPAPTDFNAEPISVEESLRGQLNDPFCPKIHRRLKQK